MRKYQNPSIAPSALAGASKTVARRDVAKNPNTPLATLAELASKLPAMVLENPALTMLALENPGAVADLQKTAYITLMCQTAPRATTQRFVWWLDSLCRIGTTGGAQHAALFLSDKPYNTSAVAMMTQYRMINDLARCWLAQSLGKTIQKSLTSFWVEQRVGSREWIDLRYSRFQSGQRVEGRVYSISLVDWAAFAFSEPWSTLFREIGTASVLRAGTEKMQDAPHHIQVLYTLTGMTPAQLQAQYELLISILDMSEAALADAIVARINEDGFDVEDQRETM